MATQNKNFIVKNGLTVNGDIIVDGTVDGVDIAGLDSDVSAEILNRQNADSDLGVLISNLDSDLGVETTNRSNADSDLASNLNVETTNRSNADSDLGVLISNLDSDLGVEVSSRGSADSDLGVLISNLDSDLGVEVSSRGSADSDLGVLISTEATNRANADSDLGARIDSDLTSLMAGNTTIDKSTFNTLLPGTLDYPGQLGWSDEYKTLELKMTSSVTLDIGQEHLIQVHNNSGSVITNGTVVMYSGAHSDSEGSHITVVPFDGTQANADATMGIATEQIEDGTHGFIATFGKVHGVNASGSEVGETWNTGDILYAKENSAVGALTKVVPADGEAVLKMPVAVVTNNDSADGVLFVRFYAYDHNHEVGHVHNVDSDLRDLIDSTETSITTAFQNADSDLLAGVDSDMSAESTLRSNADSDLGARIDSDRTAWLAADSDLGARIDSDKSAIDSDLTAGLATKLSLSGGTMSGFITLHTDPTQSLHAVPKQYVDNMATGFKATTSAEVATTGNLAATYNNGTSGVGATLTATSNGAISIDGVSLEVGDGVLVKSQTSSLQNGRYNVTQVGDSTHPFILTRGPISDESSEIPGRFVFVVDGNTYAGTGWVMNVADPDTFTIGTDAITVVQFSGSGTYTAGRNLTLTGTTFSHEASGVTAGSYGSSTAIPVLAIDSDGHITSASTSSITVGNGILTVQGTGVLGGSGTFTANQATNNTISITHDTSGVTAGTYGSTTNIPQLNVDSSGHITSISNQEVSIPPGYAGWELLVDGSSKGLISDSENVNFIGGSNVTLSYNATNNAITINSSYVNTTYSAGNGLTMTGTTIDVASHAGTAGSIGTVNISADAIGVNLGTTSTTAAAGNHTHSYLPLAGGTMTGVIDNGNSNTTGFRFDGRSFSWNSSMQTPTSNVPHIMQQTYAGWDPVMGIKTTNGFWQFGAYSSDQLHLGYMAGAFGSHSTNSFDKDITFSSNGNVGTPGQFVSTIATGTSPLAVSSTTVVSNLNADLLDGQHGSYYRINVYNNAGTLLN